MAIEDGNCIHFAKCPHIPTHASAPPGACALNAIELLSLSIKARSKMELAVGAEGVEEHLQTFARQTGHCGQGAVSGVAGVLR